MKPEIKKTARNYAQALIELTNGDINLQETFLDEIKTINDAFEQAKGTKEIFENPSISGEEKKELIKKLFSGKVDKNIYNFLFVLLDHHRFNLLLEIQNHLIKLVNKSKNIVIAEVSSAQELDNETLEKLKQKLENILSKKEKVTIETKIEPALIGGMVVKVNDLIYDGSIKGKLEGLKRRIG